MYLHLFPGGCSSVALHVAGALLDLPCWSLLPCPAPPSLFCLVLCLCGQMNNSTQKAGAMPTIRPPRQSTGPASSGLRRSRSSASSSSPTTAFACKMLFHGLLLALAFYAGIVVGMTHVHASGAAGHAAAAAAAADCPPCSADTASKSGISDAQIESIVDKRVEVGKSYGLRGSRVWHAFALYFSKAHVIHVLSRLCMS